MSTEEKDEGTIINDTMELTLRAPISSGDVQYESITLCEPIAMQIEQFTKDIDKYGAVAAQIKFISANSKVPEGAIKKLKARDYKEAVDYLSSFL